MNLHATGHHILVAPDRPAVATRSGLALPQSAQRPASTGRVVSVGPEVRKWLPDLTNGLRVAFRPFAGRALEVGGRELRLLAWDELYGILTPDAPDSRTLDGSTPSSEAQVRGAAPANSDPPSPTPGVDLASTRE